MDRINVSSSNIESIGYDEDNKILEIKFKSGGVYQYKSVPSKVFQNLINANSHGKYFSAFIKDKYPTVKLS